jgi:hypothetical protein
MISGGARAVVSGTPLGAGRESFRVSDRSMRLPPNRIVVRLYLSPLAPILGRMFLL